GSSGSFSASGRHLPQTGTNPPAAARRIPSPANRVLPTPASPTTSSNRVPAPNAARRRGSSRPPPAKPAPPTPPPAPPPPPPPGHPPPRRTPTAHNRARTSDVDRADHPNLHAHRVRLPLGNSMHGGRLLQERLRCVARAVADRIRVVMDSHH